MQEITSIWNDLLPHLSLYREIIACFVAASMVSLVIGWLMHRSRANARLIASNETWENRYQSLEVIAQVDIDELKEQLQPLSVENRKLKTKIKQLNGALREAETHIQSFRAETIELNRQHAETQERLQRIIQQKDCELIELGNQRQRLRPAKRHLHASASQSRPSQDGFEPGELSCADTIAINRAEMLDATVRVSVEELPTPSRRINQARWSSNGGSVDMPAKDMRRQDTSDVLDTDETELLDNEDTLALTRRDPGAYQGD